MRELLRSLIDEDPDTRHRASSRLMKSHVELVPAVVEGLNNLRVRGTFELLARSWETQGREEEPEVSAALRALLANVIEIAQRDLEEARRVKNDTDRDKGEDMRRGFTGYWLAIMAGRSNPTERDRKRALSLLQQFLNDKSSYVRWRTMTGISLMGPAAEPLVPALVERLKDPEHHNRYTACTVLGLIGPEAEGVVSGLLKASEDPRLRRKARYLLRRIAPEALEAETNSRRDERNRGKSRRVVPP